MRRSNDGCSVSTNCLKAGSTGLWLPATGTRTACLFGSVHSLALAAKSVAITARSPISCRNLTPWRTVIVIVVTPFICGLVGFVYGVVAGHGVLHTLLPRYRSLTGEVNKGAVFVRSGERAKSNAAPFAKDAKGSGTRRSLQQQLVGELFANPF